MPFIIERDTTDRSVLRFQGEPEFIQGLWMAPEARETILNSGNWLILVFAIWNANDYPAITHAVVAMKELQGAVKLGVRPFELENEFQTWSTWAPKETSLVSLEATGTSTERTLTIRGQQGATPIWMCLREGELIACHCGMLNNPEIHALVSTAFPGLAPL